MAKDTRAPLPYEAAAALDAVGAALRASRLARNESISTAAARVGVADSTWQRIEAGDPGVGAGVLFAALSCYGYSEALFHLADPDNDIEGAAMRRTIHRQRGSN